MKVTSAKIRMYRHGFGDCFLVRFFDGNTCCFSILIDCGLKLHDKVEEVSIEDVVADISALLTPEGEASPQLDVLVVTHEHWDHVSGFHPDKGLFDGFKIDTIWMAWTESPDDEEAIFIRNHIDKGIKALAIAGARLKEKAAAKPDAYQDSADPESRLAARAAFHETIAEVASFFGPLEATKTPGGIKLKDKYEISINSRKAINHVKEFADTYSALKYLYPGDLIEETKLPGVRIYVLGPPKSALLNKSNPSAGAQKEVYLGMNDHALNGFVNHLLQFSGDSTSNGEGPFSGNKVLTREQAQSHPFYKEYFEKTEAYRTIDDDFLSLSGALAMQLDGDTNNTSLAFAIEFEESGEVLLFPADAQVGSWLSWHDLSWRVTHKDRERTVDVTSLLHRTVFYKAGHHASHNATLKEKGLELMNSDNLVVFIPEKQDSYRGIPHPLLVKRLKEKSKGRMLFSADSNYPPEVALENKPSQLSKPDWERFKSNCTVTTLYVEYSLPIND